MSAGTAAVMLAGRWQGAGMVARSTRALTAADAGDDAALAALERSAAWSANTRDVRAYILERADAGRSIATLRADAAGIAAVHRRRRLG